MVRSAAKLRVSNQKANEDGTLSFETAAEFTVGPRVARTHWRPPHLSRRPLRGLLRMRIYSVRVAVAHPTGYCRMTSQ
jgi:hypothetical protein